ncbi:MAG: DNA replication/repair protein RecF [Parachlamydiaceae bacterium]
MHLRAIYLRNFRLYEEKLYEFNPGLNFIRGPNGHGKTSLIESIYFLMTGRSFRTSQTSELVRHHASHFCIEAFFIKHGIEQKLRVYYGGNERRITHNATTYPFLNSLLGLLQGVIIHPGDDALVKGAPGTRRQLLDTFLEQSDPLYVHHLTRYDRAMRQRNHLLRARNASTIDSWEYEMANSSAYIVKRRAEATNGLHAQGQELYKMLSGSSEIMNLCYKANGAGDDFSGEMSTALTRLRQIFRDQYRRHRPREMELGATLTGPHKDDLIISLNDREARSFGSEGQQRSCAAALRLAEWEQLQAASQETPIMLVDDIGLSLDASRKNHLLAHFAKLGQVFITTTSDC